MKATRRHDLKENELARDLGKAGEFLRGHFRAVVGVIVAVILVLAGVLYARNRVKLNRQEEWRNFYVLSAGGADPAGARDKLRRLAETTAQEALAVWGHLRVGQSAYGELCARADQDDPAEADRLARQARGAFELVISDYGSYRQAVALAHLGLGRLAETQGDLEAAREAYTRAAEQTGGSATLAALQANERLLKLGSLGGSVRFSPTAPVEAADDAGTLAPATQPVTQPAADQAPSPAATGTETPPEPADTQPGG